MSTDITAIEEKIRAMTANEEMDAEKWLGALEEGRRAGDARATGEWAVAAQEAVAKAGDLEGGLAVLKWRAEKTPPAAMGAEAWREAADRAAGSDPELHTLIKEAGFGQRLAARECVRRFTLLRALRKIGSLCWHRTWGLGVVKGFDTTNKRMVVDFRNQPHHLMALGLAAETMSLIPETHLLAKYHADPELQQLRAKQEPGEVVKEALASFGPLSVVALQERLTHSGLVPEAEWSGFWNAARKALKGDDTVDIPKKRTDPVRLLDAKSGFEDKWFEQLGLDRDLKSILAKVGELLGKEGVLERLSDAQRQVVGNRVAFVVRGAPSKQPGLRFRGVMFAAKLHMIAADCPWEALADGLLEGKETKDASGAPTGVRTYGDLRELLHDLPAREVPVALEFLHARNPEGTKKALMQELPHLQYGPLSSAMDLLLKVGAEEDCRKIYADAMARRRACQEMLLWTIKNAKRTAKWDLPQAPDMASMILDELERTVNGERLKTQKALRERFEQDEWLKVVFDGMTPGRQRDFFKRICKSEAWPGLDKQGIQARIIKLFPSLQSVVSGSTVAAASEAAGPAVALTSPRSYRERQEALAKLINEEIPANAKEIAIARSYGDLRENFEYKAAKDQQAVLNSRRDKIVAELAQVRPSDFADAPKDVVGAGTAVTIERAGGVRETYYVLGEWDNDEELHILSSATRLAKALVGRRAGDTASIPGEGGDVPCTVVSVGALPAEIADWMK